MIKAVVNILCSKDCLTTIKCLIKIYVLKTSILHRVIGKDSIFISVFLKGMSLLLKKNAHNSLYWKILMTLFK